MAIAINPVFPVVAAQSVAAGAVLQPGTVIDALVLKQLDSNLVRIAIANLTIEVLSEVPLQAGQALQLAVSQTAQGVRLQIVPGEGVSAQAAGDAASLDTVSVPKSDAPVQAAASGRVLTNLEALAVSAAVQAAAAKQGSLSPLFANLNVAASSPALPQTLQQAAARLLAQRTPLGETLTGGALKTAFRNSGLFFEQNLAGGSNTPDLKAALIVFRQALASWLGDTPQPSNAMPQSSALPPSSAPPLSPGLDGDILLPQGPLHIAEETAELAGKVHIYAPGEPLPTAANRAAAASAGLTELQELLQGMPRGVRDAVANSLAAQGDAAHSMHGPDGETVARTNIPPPPFRGSEPAAQSVAPPSLTPDDAPATVAHRLIEETDAALARQTLLQAASLPVDMPGLRTDPTMPRWNFEIPFATPQGTAVAQFEISRDGGGTGGEAEASARIWRARFSLDVEPSGPVHALVSLSKGRTSVRMWAERPATAAQLRINAPQLSHALREAALEPGDIVIGEGAPPKASPPPAGHFLDRAL